MSGIAGISPDGRKPLGVGYGKVVGSRRHQSSQAKGCLRVAQGGFPLLRIGEEFRYPRNSSHVFDTHADDRCAAENQKQWQGCSIGGGARRKGVQQDAPNEDSAAANKVSQVASKEPKHPATGQGEIKHQAHPKIELRTAWLEVSQGDEYRPHNERHNQHFVKVKSKAQGSDSADDPLQGRHAGKDGGQFRAPGAANQNGLFSC